MLLSPCSHILLAIVAMLSTLLASAVDICDFGTGLHKATSLMLTLKSLVLHLPATCDISSLYFVLVHRFLNDSG